MRAWLVVLAACGGTEAAPRETSVKLDPKSGLCVTKGVLATTVSAPTLRAVKPGTSGESAALTFVYRGDTETTRALASGKERRQLGLKLRAANGCNLVYVMWRLDPKPMLDVSVKSNPGMRTHEDCGAGGYVKVKAAETSPVPALVVGEKHVLRAVIEGDELRAYIDDALAWRGTLPGAARALAGPSGLRSDNLAFELVAFDAPNGSPSKCTAADAD